MPGIKVGVQGHGDAKKVAGQAKRKKAPGNRDRRSMYAEIERVDPNTGQTIYRRVGPAALDWNHAKEDRWNPYLATTKKPQFPPSKPGFTSAHDEDATRVYLTHRERDSDPWPFGSLNDVLLVPCHVHDGGKDKDGNPIRRLMIGIDKAEFYADDAHHGALHHVFTEVVPPRQQGTEVQVWMYYDRVGHMWRWKTTIPSGGRPPKSPGAPSTPTPPSTPPTRNPGTQPTGHGGGGKPPSGGPSGGATTTPSPTSSVPFDPEAGPGTSVNVGGLRGGLFPTPGGRLGFDSKTDPFGGGPLVPTRGAGSGVTHAGGTVAPRGAPSAESGLGGGIGDPSGPQPYGDPTSPNPYNWVPSRTSGVPHDSHQHIRVSPTTTPSVYTGNYSNRPTRAARGWHGTPLYTAGVEYLPSRPSRKWRGSPSLSDPGEVNVTPTVDWADGPTTFTQDDYDNWTDPTTRTEIFDAINNHDAYITATDTAQRKMVTDSGTATVAAGMTTATVTTSYPYTGSTPRLQGTAIGGSYIVSTESFVATPGSTAQADIRISDAAPAGGVEVDYTWSYAVDTSVDLC